MDRARRALAIAGAVWTTLSLAGCWAVNNRDADLDRSPVVNTGAGASIIYPGQTAPPHPGNYHPREAGYGQGVMANPGAPQSASATPAPGSAPGASRAPAGAVGSQIAVPPP